MSSDHEQSPNVPKPTWLKRRIPAMFPLMVVGQKYILTFFGGRSGRINNIKNNKKGGHKLWLFSRNQ